MDSTLLRLPTTRKLVRCASNAQVECYLGRVEGTEPVEHEERIENMVLHKKHVNVLASFASKQYVLKVN